MGDTFFVCELVNGYTESFNGKCNFVEEFSNDMMAFKAKDFETKNECILQLIPKDKIMRIIHRGICEKLYNNPELLKGGGFDA